MVVLDVLVSFNVSLFVEQGIGHGELRVVINPWIWSPKRSPGLPEGHPSLQDASDPLQLRPCQPELLCPLSMLVLHWQLRGTVTVTFHTFSHVTRGVLRRRRGHPIDSDVSSPRARKLEAYAPWCQPSLPRSSRLAQMAKLEGRMQLPLLFAKFCLSRGSESGCQCHGSHGLGSVAPGPIATVERFVVQVYCSWELSPPSVAAAQRLVWGHGKLIMLLRVVWSASRLRLGPGRPFYVTLVHLASWEVQYVTQYNTLAI